MQRDGQNDLSAFREEAKLDDFGVGHHCVALVGVSLAFFANDFFTLQTHRKLKENNMLLFNEKVLMVSNKQIKKSSTLCTRGWDWTMTCKT